MSGARVSGQVHAARIDRARRAMGERGIDALLISVGHDMPYLVGYQAMPLERLTMLVLPREGRASLVIPRLEAPRVDHHAELFDLVPWDETQDPVAICDRLCGDAAVVAVGDQMWSRFLVDLIAMRPTTAWRRASEILGAMRALKDDAEISALRDAAAAVDRIAAELQAGRIPLVGRTEAQISADLSARILAEGHDKVNFAIVAAGENAASPHHHAGSRVVRPGEIVLCDFGGTMAGYCSDITRCVHVGEPSAEVAEAYEVLFAAQAAAVAAATVGTPCEDVDRAARAVIEDAGYGRWFVHRTGHGIGLEEHEDPYIVSGNGTRLVHGHAFSIEPGIYVPDKWGMRLEDIVVATDGGPDALNRVDHRLVVVDG